MKKLLVTILILMNISTISANNITNQDLYIHSNNYLLYDLDSGQRLLDNRSDNKIFPASITKTITLLVAIENIDNIKDEVELGHDIFEGLYEAQASMANFQLFEKVTLEDCMHGLLLVSGADAGRCLANYVSGSEEEFVKLMNAKARELNMNDTNFVNTSGLHDHNHYTTLNDIAKFMDYALKNETFYQIFTILNYTSSKTPEHPDGITFTNSSKKISNYYTSNKTNYVIGGKTGFTDEAGLTLVTLGSDGNSNLLCISAKADPSSYARHIVDHVNIYDYYFSNYQKTTIANKETPIIKATMNYRLYDNEIELFPKDNINLLLPKNSLNKISYNLKNPNIELPIKKDTPIAKLDVILDKKIIMTIDLVSKTDEERNTFLDFISKFL